MGKNIMIINQEGDCVPGSIWDDSKHHADDGLEGFLMSQELVWIDLERSEFAIKHIDKAIKMLELIKVDYPAVVYERIRKLLKVLKESPDYYIGISY